jgi:uncharacterized protein YacL
VLLANVLLTSLVAVGVAAGAGVGLWGSSLLVATSPVLNVVFLGGAGGGLGFLVAYALRHKVRARMLVVVGRLRMIPGEVVIGSVLGGTIGLTFAVMLNLMLERVPGFSWEWGLLVGFVSIVGFSSLTVRHRSSLKGLALGGPKDAEVKPELLLDTSAVIDARTLGLLRVGIWAGPIVVPVRVLNELHSINSLPQPSRRARGAIGLRNLEVMEAEFGKLRSLDDDFPREQHNDVIISELAVRNDLILLTCDNQLTRITRLRGGRVLNVNEVSHAMRPVWKVGDDVMIYLEERGTDDDQAVGHLDDGSLVVVRGAVKLVGQTVKARVSNVLERPSGKIYFSELVR